MPKLDVLSYVEEQGEVRSVDLAGAFSWTLAGASATLLRLHRHGHLRRRREATGFVYRLSQKGIGYIEWARQEG